MRYSGLLHDNAAMQRFPSPSVGRQARVDSRILVLLVLIATVLSGCRGHDGRGPLSEGSGSATSCFPKRGGTQYILGSDALTNTGHGPVTVDSVQLVGASNLVQTGAFVSPVPSHGPVTIMGNVTGTPWAFYAKGQRALWQNKVPAQNAVVSPTSLGTDFNLLVATRAPQPSEESTARIEVKYHASGSAAVWHSTVTYRAVSGRSC